MKLEIEPEARYRLEVEGIAVLETALTVPASQGVTANGIDRDGSVTARRVAKSLLSVFIIVDEDDESLHVRVEFL